MTITSRPWAISRRAAAVVAALAIAAPVAAIAAPVSEAGATTIYIPMPDSITLPFDLTFTDPAIGGIVFVHGGLALNDVLNGGTTVVDSTGPAQGNTIASP